MNNLTVGPALGCGQEIRSWGDSLTSWLASHKVDANLARDGLKAHQTEHKFPLGTLALDLKLVSHFWPRKAHQISASTSKLKFSHLAAAL